MEKFALILIIIHAVFGGIALLAGIIPMVGKKGDKPHKLFGKIFVVCMLISALIALIIAVLPGHENPFLFGVGLFSSYLAYTGNRALKYKQANISLTQDKVVSALMALAGVGMIIIPFMSMRDGLNVVSIVFGATAVAFAIRDLIIYSVPKAVQKKWLTLHVGKIVGSYIAATTAFIVTNSLLPGLLGWFLPGVLGSFFIAYWMRKIRKGKRIMPPPVTAQK